MSAVCATEMNLHAMFPQLQDLPPVSYTHLADMVWVTTGGDMETVNRLTDVLVTMNTPADRGKLFKIIKMAGRRSQVSNNIPVYEHRHPDGV